MLNVLFRVELSMCLLLESTEIEREKERERENLLSHVSLSLLLLSPEKVTVHSEFEKGYNRWADNITIYTKW